MSLFALSKTKMILENAIHPVLNMDYRYDYGFIMGHAFDLSSPSQTRFSKRGHHNALGIAFKSLSRQSLAGNYDLFGTELLQIIDDSDNFREVRENLGHSKGSGRGIDLGWEYSYFFPGSRIGLGVSWLDLGDIHFERKEGRGPIPVQRESLHFGSALDQDFKLFDYTLSLDYHNALESKSFSFRYLHLGGRLKLPLLDFYIGYNGGYKSWGLSMDVFFFNFKMGFYGVEIGQSYREMQAKNIVFSLSLLELSFKNLGLDF